MPVPSDEVQKSFDDALARDIGTVGLDNETIEEWNRLTELQKRQPTSAENWNSPRKQGFLVELPSGQVTRMRRTMNIVKAIRDGKLPNPLNETVQKNIAEGSPELVLPNLQGEELIQAMNLIDETVVMAMVEPRVMIPPEDQSAELWEAPPGCISIMDVELADKLFICEVAQGGSTDLNKFRRQQNIVVEPVSTSDGMEQPPERPARSKRPAKKRSPVKA